MFRSLAMVMACVAGETMEGNFTDSGLGFNLHYTAPEDSSTYPVILFVSGFSGLAPAFTYSTFTNKLAKRGYIVVGMDHVQLPDYPSQGQAFYNIMEWTKAGNLAQALKDAKVAAVPDLEHVAVMGQSAGNHVIGQGLTDGCSLAKAQIMIDPVDGFDPFGFVTAQNLITPGKPLKYTTPTLLLDNELDPTANGFGVIVPPCAPANLGAPRWFNAVAGPVWNVNASKYGHIDCLDDLYILAGGLACPTNAKTDKNAYRTHLSNAIDIFLSGLFKAQVKNFDMLEDASSFAIDVTLRKNLQGLSHGDIKPGCTNQAVVV